MSVGEQFATLVSLMARLRSETGCAWDREQTFASLKPYLIEEAYEVLEAIDAGDWPSLADELGDLLLQPVFLAQMASDAGHFTIADSLEAINAKLIRRHPHVFGDGQADTADEVKQRWDEIKASEKPDRQRGSSLDGVPRALPALVEAEKVSQKAAKVGFDWPQVAQVEEKLAEELQELTHARSQGDQAAIAEEFGDLLFTLVNLARHLRVDPEQALRAATRKFRSRFGQVEKALQRQGRTPEAASLDELEALWQEAKRST